MDPYDQFFKCYPAEVQAISRELRALVRRALPEANDVLVDRHNHITYDFNAASRTTVVYISVLAALVSEAWAEARNRLGLPLAQGKQKRL